MQTSQTLPLPPLPPGAPGRPEGRRWRPQFGVIVLVSDEAAQRSAFEDLTARGYRCKPVST